MDSDSFKKYFSSSMGIIAAVSVLLIILCLCCIVLAAIGQNSETPTTYAAPANCCRSI